MLTVISLRLEIPPALTADGLPDDDAADSGLLEAARRLAALAEWSEPEVEARGGAASDDAIDDITAATDALYYEIAARPAHTWAGLAVKLDALRRSVVEDEGPEAVAPDLVTTVIAAVAELRPDPA